MHAGVRRTGRDGSAHRERRATGVVATPRNVDLPLPRAGEAVSVADGVYWVRLPMPFRLDHINIWLLRDGDGWTVVDTGIGNQDTYAHWQTLLVDVLRGRPIRRVIATHWHPDHVGVAGWLCARDDAPLCMTQTEWLTMRLVMSDIGDEVIQQRVEFFRRAGCGDAYLGYVRDHQPTYASLVVSPPRSFRRLAEGDELVIGGRRWRVLTGGGHSPEHACLFAPASGILIAGDQVLPRISPNVGVNAWDPDADPLADYLSALRRMRAVPDDLTVLPSHGTPFRGLHARLDELAAHHKARLAQLRECCVAPWTAAEAARVLFDRPLDMQNLGFAIAETLAHLNHLVGTGVARRTSRDDGVWLYHARARA
jgi:glyoxylase-like metal-dependent hydrolase (beta-lactamase superfamily II)